MSIDPVSKTIDAQSNTVCTTHYGDSWIKTTRDAQGNEVYLEYSSGYWKKTTRDAQGNEVYREDYSGYWYKTTRDAQGNEVYRSNFFGLERCTLAADRFYELRYFPKTKRVTAGCRNFDLEEALVHWGDPKRTDDRAIAFEFALLNLKEALKLSNSY